MTGFTVHAFDILAMLQGGDEGRGQQHSLHVFVK